MSGYPETVYVVHVTAPFFGRAWEERPTGYSVRYDMHDGDVADRIATLKAKIASLTTERDQARAEAEAAYERAAQVCARNEERAFKQGRGDFWAHRIDKDEIRALATEPGTTALAEIVKKAVDEDRKQFDGYILHKRNCDMMSAFIQGKHCTCGLDAILARIDKRKEAGV